MFCTKSTRALSRLAESTPTTQTTLPAFLLPAFDPTPRTRPFSSTRAQNSHIGRAPLVIPLNVDISITPPPPTAIGRPVDRRAKTTVTISGPLGTLTYPMEPFVTLTHDVAAARATVSIASPSEKTQKCFWGTTRAELANHILGVSEGHTAILRMVGVGYRATVESKAVTKTAAYEGQMFVNLKVGYSHPIEMGVPRGVKASTPQPTRILLEGPDKHVLMQFAAEIREWRRPEPYKGKGIFVNGETIKLKAKKIK